MEAKKAALKKIQEDAIKRRLSRIERNKLIRQEIERLDIEKQRGEELIGKSDEEKIRILQKKVAKDLFIEQRVVETVRREGKDIPIIKTVVVDERGNIMRKATTEERKLVREVGQRLRVPEKLEKADIRRLEKRATELRQKRLRGKGDLKGELELAGLTASGVVIGTGLALTQLPQLPGAALSFTKKVIKDPASLREIPEAIKRGGAEFGQLLRISPTEALVKIGSEILIMKGIGKALKITGRLTSRIATRLSPKFRGVAKRAISIPSLQKGKTLTIKVSSKLGRGRIPEQLKFAGKRTTAVSAQANRLVNFIKTGKIIRKPIPNEAKLTKVTKKLLKKFDKGKITAKELVRLDRRIRVEAKKGLLERSFFADPDAVVRKRFLRLGTEKEASLLDTLSGDVTFKTSKPQILIFEDIKVQAFPKTKIFKTITKKLKTGKVLTQKESGALVKFQLKKTGKFKPLGFQTTEKEITLSPGEMIKKQKTVAVTLINGKRVPIVRAVVVKAKPVTKKLLSKAKKGKITAKELKILRRNLKKETRFKTSISDSRISKPRLPLGRKAVSVAIRAKRRIIKRKPLKRIPGRIPGRKPIRRRIPKRKIVKKPVKRIPVRRPIRKPPKKPTEIFRRRAAPVRRGEKPAKPVRIPRRKKLRKPLKKPKAIRGYNVYGKHRGKFMKLNKVPLSKRDALHRGAFSIDKSTANTFKIESAKKVKKFGRLTKGEKGHFSRTRKKYRSYRIQKGRRITLKDKFIEKRGKPRIDTRGEKRGLDLAKFAKQRGFVGRRKNPTPRKSVGPSRRSPQKSMPIKRKATPQQLMNLAKGRKIRQQNLRRGG